MALINIATPGNRKETLECLCRLFLTKALEAIDAHGFFSVAFSGGKTPLDFFQLLEKDYADALPWKKVKAFWSDERSVPLDSDRSNCGSALRAGLEKLQIQPFPFYEGGDLQKAASKYENLFHTELHEGAFDLILLGIGQDGHCASLFPGSQALHEETKEAFAHTIPSSGEWRLTLTFPCLAKARGVWILVLGQEKAEILQALFQGQGQYPVQRIENPLWICDRAAIGKLLEKSLIEATQE